MPEDGEARAQAHAEALHVLQDLQENIRDAKRSQWNTTHYAALLYAALVTTLTLFDNRMRATPLEKGFLIAATLVILVVWAVVICQLQCDLKRRRREASVTQHRWFTDQFMTFLDDKERSCPAQPKDWPILLALSLVAVGGAVLTLWIILR